MLKLKPYRSRAWLSAVHELESCVLCGAVPRVPYRN